MIFRVQKFKKSTGTILFLFLFLSAVVSSFSLLFSNEPFFNGVNPDFQTKNPVTSIKFDWNIEINKSGESEGRDVIVDASDNIYIVGKEYNVSKGAFDIIIVKYDHSGNLLWNKTWGGDFNDLGYSIDIDSSNNVYIVGETKSYGNGSSDICLIKFNSSGDFQWNKTWGGLEYETARGIVMDEVDNVYVVGFTESYGVLGEVVLIKYDTSGLIEWIKFWGDIDTDFANDLGVDSSGNIYITGYTSSFGADTSNLFLVKYNNSGNLQWNVTWGGTLPDSGKSLKITPLDEIFMVGNTQNFGAGNNDIAILKFNSTGDLIWNTTWGGKEQDYGYSIALDSKENIFLSGYTKSYDSNDKDACVVKFTSDGELKWFKTWSDEYDDVFFGIEIDSGDNVYLTGKTQSPGADYHIFLIKYLPIPDDFELISVDTFPDQDGNFTLSWTKSLDADNYTLYQSNNFITTINESLVEVVKGNINHTQALKNMDEGVYYYVVVAFNYYGNTSSNCLKAIVQYPPSEFVLNNNSQIPIGNGIVNLTWSKSIGADNYSVFVHDSYIYEIKNNGTLILDGITKRFFLIENLTNSYYYFVIIANNQAGKKMSNCIKVVVRRVPDHFTLTSDAGDPDENGNFDLIWTRSEFSRNYSIYFSNSSFSEINETVQVLYIGYIPLFDWPTYRYQISGWDNGTYFFKIVAYNEYGNHSTNSLKVVVKLPKENDEIVVEKGINLFKINPEIVLILIFVGTIGVLIFVHSKHKRFLRK